jgi:hypothetical protein
MSYEWAILALLVWDLFESNNVEHDDANMKLCKSLQEQADDRRHGNRSRMIVERSTLNLFLKAVRFARKKRGTKYTKYERANAEYAKVLKQSLKQNLENIEK